MNDHSASGSLWGAIRLAPRRCVVGVLHAYQRWISPILPPLCRFYPTCSAYAAEAIARYGLGRGTWMAVVRLSKCHPYHPGGYDLVN